MLWQTLRAFFLPAAHPGLYPVRERGGEELLPKLDERGRPVEEGDGVGVWESYRAGRRRAYNRAVVRPHMGRYIRRWLGLGAALALAGWACAAAGLAWATGALLGLAGLACLVALLLLLLWQDIRQ